MTRVVCGHTHRAVCFQERGGWDLPASDVTSQLCQYNGYLIYPGSVGQSRFEAPLARHARYDDETETLTFFAMPYNHLVVRKKLRQHGLVA